MAPARAAAMLLPVLAAVALVWPARQRVMQLPAGIVDLHTAMIVDEGTEVRGAAAGTTLRMAGDFSGPAAIVIRGSGVRLRDFVIEGNRADSGRAELPPSDVAFSRFTRGNGVLAAGVAGLRIERVRFRELSGFAVLVSASRDVAMDRVIVSDSGSSNAAGRNNTTGGILFEEGCADFRVTASDFQAILGNALWTHSLYTSPRNVRGQFAWNRFETVGRDAIQVGHATDVHVIGNAGRRIGFPLEDVDIENLGVPVAIDTAGNVERCSYSGNRFEEVDGKCIDLDGFHDGEVRGNVCINSAPPESYRFGNYGIVMNNSNPDMQSRNIRIVDNLIDSPLFGGIFVIGAGHLIARNRLLNLNTARCNEEAARFGCYYAPGEPDMLRSGIYLGRGAHRPDAARDNVVEDNRITGFRMAARCIAVAPGVEPSRNTLRGNQCRDAGQLKPP